MSRIDPSRVLVFILAGGRGERLHPLTECRPKPLVAFGGDYRLIDFTLANCFNAGFPHLRVLTQHDSTLIQEHVQCRASHARVYRGYAASLSCLNPEPRKVYRGTGDAVYQNLHCLDQTQAESVVILSSDHIYSMDYLDLVRFHCVSGSEVTVAATECPSTEATQFGVLETDSGRRVIGFEEKPSVPKTIPANPHRSLVSMGIYVFNVATLRRALTDTGHLLSLDFGRDVIPPLVSGGLVSVYNFTAFGNKLSTYWRDVGTLDAYYTSNMELLSNSVPALRRVAKWPFYRPDSCRYNISTCATVRNSIVTQATTIDGDATISRSVLSVQVSVGNGTTIEDSVLMPGVRVGKGVRIRRTIIDENVAIPDGMQIGFDSAQDSRIGILTKAGVTVIPAGIPLVTPAPRYAFA